MYDNLQYRSTTDAHISILSDREDADERVLKRSREVIERIHIILNPT